MTFNFEFNLFNIVLFLDICNLDQEHESESNANNNNISATYNQHQSLALNSDSNSTIVCTSAIRTASIETNTATTTLASSNVVTTVTASRVSPLISPSSANISQLLLSENDEKRDKISRNRKTVSDVIRCVLFLVSFGKYASVSTKKKSVEISACRYSQYIFTKCINCTDFSTGMLKFWTVFLYVLRPVNNGIFSG